MRSANPATARLRRSRILDELSAAASVRPDLAFLCNKDVVDDYIEPVPTSYGERTAPGRLTLRTFSSNRIKIDPYPFDANHLRVQLIRRRLQQSTFADPAAFRQTYFKATPEALDFTFCAR